MGADVGRAFARALEWIVCVALASSVAACGEDVRIGGSCERNGECSDGLVCNRGRCMEECRGSRDCILGAICTFERGLGTCTLEDDRCASDAECGEGLACALERCVNACDEDDDCGAGDACWSVPDLERSFCIDPRQPPTGGGPIGSPDGGAPDAGVEDASVEDAGDGGGPCAGPGCDPVVRVAIAWQHACAVTASGRIWCWGHDGGGESSGEVPASIECEPARCRRRPVEIARVAGVAANEIALGNAWSCARRVDGTVQCWGTIRPAPAPLSPAPALVEVGADAAPLDGALAIRAGRTHLLIDRTDGLYGAGTDDRGELQGSGGGTTAERIVGRASASVTTIVGAGAFFSCVIESGVVSCWGTNHHRELGRDDPAPADDAFSPASAPVQGIGIGPAIELALGGQHGCAMDGTGAIACWGQSRQRTDLSVPPELVPRAGVALRDLASASSADRQLTCARSASSPSSAYCWGAALDGFYPPGTLDTTRAVRMWPGELGDVQQVATDGSTACVVSEGDVLCWGDNSVGQLGQGDVASRPGPVRVRW